MPGQLKVGIAGAGFSGAVHARAVRAAGALVWGVAASSAERARVAAGQIGAARAFRSAEELVEADEIDVVHICTPNHLHAPLVKRALGAGKHVICEKPLAPDHEAAFELTEAARASGRVSAVPFVYRYYAVVREARERIRSGGCGAVRLLHGSYLQDWLLSAEDDNWRVDGHLGGASRAFADIGSHWCDLAEFVSGQRITRLGARTMTAVPERRLAARRAAFATGNGSDRTRRVTTEDAAMVHFETDGGALGSLVVSQISAGRKNRLWIEIDCTREALVFDQEHPETLWCGGRDETKTLWRDPTSMSPAAARLAFLPAGHPQGYQDCFDQFVADCYAAIATGVSPEGLPVFADGARAAQITDAVLRSARDERWVDLAVADGRVSKSVVDSEFVR
jgi:predicted dehydrogenase